MTAMRELYSRIQPLYHLGEMTEQRPNLAFVTVEPIRLRSLLRYLKTHEGFTHLVLLTAVDWIEEGVFQLTYMLHDRAGARDIGVRLMLPRDKATMESIHDIWPTAATYQRELREMFGINFPDSPRVNEDFILERWSRTPPYRRDFDTKKFAEEFYAERPGRETNDPAEFMSKFLPGGK